MNPSRRKFLRVAAGTAGLALVTRAPGAVARPSSAARAPRGRAIGEDVSRR